MALRVAAIGLGGLGQLELEVLTTLDRTEIVAGTDVLSDARRVFEREFEAPAYEGYEAMLDAHGDSIDAALIVTPHTLHFEQAKACLESDIHVYLEKPMVTDVADATELVELADDRELVLQIGYQRHFHPGFTEVKRVVDSGRIGEIHAANAYLGQNWIEMHRGTWRVRPGLSGGGQLYDTGSHLLDALLWMTGTTPETVAAQIQYESPKIDVNSALSISLDRDGDPVIAGVTVSGDGVDLSPMEGYAIWGTRGLVSFDGRTIRLAERGATVYESAVDAQTDFTTLTTAKLTNFLESIRREASPAVPGEVGLQVTALTEAAYAAADRGTRVDVQALIRDAE